MESYFAKIAEIITVYLDEIIKFDATVDYTERSGEQSEIISMSEKESQNSTLRPANIS